MRNWLQRSFGDQLDAAERLAHATDPIGCFTATEGGGIEHLEQLPSKPG